MTSPFLTSVLRRHAEPPSETSPLEALLQDRDFRRRLSESQLRELNSLNGERSSTLLGEALYSFGSRQEQAGHSELAISVYQALSANGDFGQLHARAESSLNALLGRGPWRQRIESLGRRFVAQATDPAMILAFGLAGGIANWVRGGTMASLAFRAPSLLSRGFGARFLAGATSYLAEVPAFVATSRVARSYLHPQAVDGTWGEELAGAALFLGVLRVSGGAAEEALRVREFSSVVHRGVATFAQLGGIYSAHALQENFGLRPVGDASSRVVDTLDSFLQMQVGGRLMQGAIPEVSPHLARALASETPRLGALSNPGIVELNARETSRFSLPDRLAAAEREGDIPAPLGQPISSLETENAARREILQRYDREYAVGIIQSFEAIAKLLEVPLDSVFAVGRPGLELEGGRLFRGLRRLRHAAQYSSTDGLKGNYLNWLLRVSTHEAVRQSRGDWALRLIEHLESGASVETLEALVAEQLPSYDLFGRGVVRGAPTRDIPLTRASERAIQGLPLSVEAKEVLTRFGRYQGEIPLNFFQDLGERLRSSDPVATIIEPTLLGLRESPVAYLRLVRLFQILEHDGAIHAKLFELNDSQLHLWGDGQRNDAPLALFRSQGDGYLGEGRWVEYINAMRVESEPLRQPLAAMMRRERTEEILRSVWPEPCDLTPEDVLTALERLADPMSMRVAQALRSGQVELRFLSDADFAESFARENGNQRGELVQAFLLPASEVHARDRLVMRQIQRVSDFVFRRALIERLVHAVHEFDHHLHPPLSPRNDLSALREELPAHLRHIQYRATLGYPEELEAMFSESPAGPALYLRDKVEAAYFLRYLRRPAVSAAMALEPAAVAGRLTGLQDQSDYIHGLLNLGTRAVDSPNLLEWLQEADWSLDAFQRDLHATRGAFNIAERGGAPVAESARAEFEILDAAFTKYRRVSRQLRTIHQLSLRPPTDRRDVEIRRRRDWIASLGDFDIVRVASESPRTGVMPRYEVGLNLMGRFLPRLDETQVDIYERAARGPIRDRDIAFDLDKTLGDTLLRYLAQDAFRERPESYDIGMEDIVHQYTRMRLPYRGIQAMLLGLWAAGNRVRLYTASENLVGNHEVFFNDFPLIKVAMEIAPPQDAERLVTPEDLHAAPHFMDRLKFREFYERHFGDERGRGFLEEVAREQGLRRLPDLTVAKLPFPDFPFDVL
ncbi:MAG: hypothetical protein K8R69_07695, partial [Deltaproteobacteria bacterium]|nr:hypothetical protein [Deltaproteobacteria bacterium]